MRFFVAIAGLAVAKETTAHSWLTGVGGGELRGGLSKSDSHDERYYCPTPNLADCQPDDRQHVKLTAEAQRPCLAGRSPVLGTGQPGGKILVQWASNGHANSQSDGTCVTVRLAKYANDPNDSDFKTLESCLPYYHDNAETDAEVTLPSGLSEGDYTVQWVWNFGSFWYSSCTDISVSSGAQGADGKAGPATDKSVATTQAPKSSEAPAPLVGDVLTATVKTTALPTVAGPSAADMATYREKGCAALANPKAFCKGLLKGHSYCKDFLPDECGRARCHGDDGSEFGKCTANVLLV